MATEERFDPMNSPVDRADIPRLDDIAAQARYLLARQTSEDIWTAQETIEGWIEGFFEETFLEEVGRLRKLAESGKQSAIDFFHVERRFNGDGFEEYLYEIGKFDDRFRGDLDILNESNTTGPQALDACIGWFYLSETVFGDDSEPMFFAALALAYVEAALWYHDQRMQPDTDSKVSDAELLKLAYAEAMNALEAITMADQYFYWNSRRKDFEKSENEAALLAVREHQARRESEDARKNKERGERLSAIRDAHKKRAESLVLTDWESDKSRFPSAKVAGDHYSAWLKDLPGKHFKAKPSTCATWIRQRASQLGIKWR
ncbi:hypothetical protein [Burkholderia gladioli]|uniref:hypothetical protein n=1 Tax=Burkholderia gladioli TaxID=28095 RepID=UPI001641F99F|nr:hypothetical protein [Burkholderia gladioli]MDN7917637.1 hypothetical protein [Burkholderia gladioli]